MIFFNSVVIVKRNETGFPLYRLGLLLDLSAADDLHVSGGKMVGNLSAL